MCKVLCPRRDVGDEEARGEGEEQVGAAHGEIFFVSAYLLIRSVGECRIDCRTSSFCDYPSKRFLLLFTRGQKLNP